jgi:hypothetical protein
MAATATAARPRRRQVGTTGLLQGPSSPPWRSFHSPRRYFHVTVCTHLNHRVDHGTRSWRRSALNP